MTLVGLLGSALVCLSYFLLVRGKVTALSPAYLGINLTGSVCLLLALLHHYKDSNLGPVILQTVMIAISLYGFYKSWRTR